MLSTSTIGISESNFDDRKVGFTDTARENPAFRFTVKSIYLAQFEDWGILLCSRNLGIDSLDQGSVDETEGSACITNSGITSTLNDLTSDNSTHGIDFPESTGIDNGRIKRCRAAKLRAIDVTCRLTLIQ